MKFHILKISFLASLFLTFISNAQHVHFNDRNEESLIFLDSELAKIIVEFLENQNLDDKTISPEIKRCYKELSEKNYATNADDLIDTLVFIINTKAPGIIAQRAPRPHAPAINNAVVGPLVSCDLGEIIKLLELFKRSIFLCCAQLDNDFTQLFIDLTLIIENLTTYCTLITATAEFQGTFTALQDLKNTLTVCCSAITNNFQNTFTIIAAGFSTSFTEISDLNNTLTTCCQEIQINFDGTFTALNSLKSSLTCLPPCGTLAITASTVITTPGSYCLSNDIVGPITINASNVTLDLNNYTIVGSGIGSGAGIIINAGTNRSVKNGRITNFDTGVLSTANVTTELITVIINGCFAEGVTIANGTDVHLDSLVITNIGGSGVHLTGNNTTFLIRNVLITTSLEGFIFDSISNSQIQDCIVADCSSSALARGFAILNGSFNQFDNCSVKNLVSTLESRGFFLSNAQNSLLRDCTAQNIITTLGISAEGFECADLSNTIALIRCSALDLEASSVSAGFELDGSSIVLNDCLSQSCHATNLNGNGFMCTGTDITLTNCQAFDCQSTGFIISTTNCSLQYCQSAYNAIGFLNNNPNVSIGNSVAVHNNSIGFENTALTLSIYYCFASDNGVSNYVGIPNVQNASTQVNNADPGLTGPFAGVNLFI